MSDKGNNVEQFDEWLEDESDVAALVMRQWLEPVEGKDAVIFPPTYAKPEGVRDADWLGYNIDAFDDGSNVCQIDSVGSQANRMEPIFKRDKYRNLVPQVVIKAGERHVHLLDAGHRAADAIVRFAGKPQADDSPDAKTLAEHLWDAFRARDERGDSEPLARIAPTSIVFGAWDSRATQAKLPRIVRSVIRAYNVKACTRSAQFNTPLHYVHEGLIDEKLDKGQGKQNPLSQEGFHDSPAESSHGGVIVLGDIRRDASLNLATLRGLGVRPANGKNSEEAKQRVRRLRRYILGLALVALTHADGEQLNLREGCLLRIAASPSWKEVPFHGHQREHPIEASGALAFATAAAAEFGVQKLEQTFLFDSRKAEAWLKLRKDTRDKLRRKGPVLGQEL